MTMKLTFAITVSLIFVTQVVAEETGTITGSITSVIEWNTPVQFNEGNTFFATFEVANGDRKQMYSERQNYVWTQPNPDDDSATIGTFTMRIDSTDFALLHASLLVLHNDWNGEFSVRVRCEEGIDCGFTGGLSSVSMHASKPRIPDPSPDEIDQSYALDAFSEFAVAGELDMLLRFGDSSVVVNVEEFKTE
jgi:hypothetical protein